MTRRLLPLLLALAPAALAQTPATPPSGPAAEAMVRYQSQKTNVVKAAEKMPEADYQYRPTPEVRTFARVVNHVTEAQFQSCSAQAGTKFDKASVPSDTATKAVIVAGLKASFDLCDKAYAMLTDANIAEQITAGPAKRSRITLAWGNISHDNEQYAELSTYLRLKNLVPPTAEK